MRKPHINKKTLRQVIGCNHLRNEWQLFNVGSKSRVCFITFKLCIQASLDIFKNHKYIWTSILPWVVKVVKKFSLAQANPSLFLWHGGKMKVLVGQLCVMMCVKSWHDARQLKCLWHFVEVNSVTFIEKMILIQDINKISDDKT